jgi:hypothetical protein
MSHLPLRHGLPTQETPVGRRIDTLTDPDLITVVTVWVLSLLVVFNLMLRFPDLGTLIEQYNQF